MTPRLPGPLAGPGHVMPAVRAGSLRAKKMRAACVSVYVCSMCVRARCFSKIQCVRVYKVLVGNIRCVCMHVCMCVRMFPAGGYIDLVIVCVSVCTFQRVAISIWHYLFTSSKWGLWRLRGLWWPQGLKGLRGLRRVSSFWVFLNVPTRIKAHF